MRTALKSHDRSMSQTEKERVGTAAKCNVIAHTDQNGKG